jgi:hypothetical protein
MNPDIITSAPRPDELPPTVREMRGRAGEPGEGAAWSWRTTLEALARTLILAIASAPPLRRIEGIVERRFAADDARQQEAEAAAAARVLRVYTQLAEGEQRSVDELLRDGSLDEVLATIVRRTDDDALDALRRRIGTIEPAVSAASLARQIGGLRGHLTNEEYDRVILRLPHLSTEEQQVLHAHLRALTPADAAMLLRSYVRPIRS